MTKKSLPTPPSTAWMAEHVDFVTRLARSLVADRELAEDAAQDALAAAAAAPPSSRENVRGWFGQVVRRTLTRNQRTNTRRQQRERHVAARDRSAEAAAECVANVEAHRDLSDAVLALDEPYRTTITLRFFEDLSIDEVAQRMGVPKNTARSRLSRGLASLRQRLDRRHGSRAAWVGVLAPLARRKLGGVVGSAVVTTGSAIMLKKIAVVLLVLAGCLFAVVSWFPATDPPAAARTGSLPTAATGSTAAPQPDSPTGSEPLDRVAAAAKPRSPQPPAASANGNVLTNVRGEPIAGVRMRRLGPATVRWQGGDSGWISGPHESLKLSSGDVDRLRSDPEHAAEFFAARRHPDQWRAAILGTALPAQEVSTTATGSFSFRDDGPVRPDNVALVEPGWTLLARPAEPTGRFLGANAVEVRGRLIDPQGKPIAGGFVTVDVQRALPRKSDQLKPARFREMRSADGTGAFHLRSVPTAAGVLLRVRAEGYAAAALPAPLQTTEELDVVMWPLDEQLRLLVEGTVQGRDGQPIDGALVAVARQQTRTDANGRFRLQLDKVSPSTSLNVIAKGLQAHQRRGFGQRLLDDPNAGRRLRIRLDRDSLTLRAVVLEPGGAPAVGYGVNLVDATLLDYSFRSVEARIGDRDRQIETDASGQFELNGLSDRPYRIRIWNPRTGYADHLGPFRATRDEVVIQLPDAARARRIVGRVRNADGTPVPSARVLRCWCTYVNRSGGTMWEDAGQAVVADADGAFALDAVPAGAGVLVAETDDGRRAAMPLAAIDNPATVELTIDGTTRWLMLLADSQRAALPVTVVDADDRQLPFTVYANGARNRCKQTVVHEPVLIRVPTTAAAVQIAPRSATGSRVAIDRTTTHVHIRGWR